MKKRDMMWIFLFLIVFINGFEAGGYQASLYVIGQTYDLSVANMGLFASVELFATMLAPLILGNWADKSDKIKCILILLGIQMCFSVAIFSIDLEAMFIGGIFFLGLTTSALQFIAIAALVELYPLTGKKKIGFLTSMYALGALLSPLFVDFYLKRNISWKMLFLTLAIGSALAIAGTLLTGKNLSETADVDADDGEISGGFMVVGVLLLCVVMCIYVGFENGFAFFIDTMFTKELNSSSGKYALSIFWAVMIPSRIIVGLFSRHAKKILYASVIAIPVLTLVTANMTSGNIVMALCIPLGFASGAIYPSVLTTLMNYSGERKATATAMITVSTGIGGVVFTALTGIMADAFGIRHAMMILGGFFIISLICVYSTKLVEKRGAGDEMTEKIS
ncbi:Fucose permease [Acetitomaculum ruminis DSM 5522]|uniref:Fucose permease n=1 Tax=Acetitomaculum ruminis DSM 5522 TaxID=1120918 RepID=A0A1I1ALA4_9FIRM|nr:MFS transporter [Acetitomaculum ruminis]SFB38821.1 Fucose permease [Acetitomaculum ruminis DSM 5522]